MRDAELTFAAAQLKSRKPYVVTVTPAHLHVLSFLTRHGATSDYDLVRQSPGRSHQLGARRCELRDGGFVEQDGKCPSGMTWRLTEEGEKALDRWDRAVAAR